MKIKKGMKIPERLEPPKDDFELCPNPNCLNGWVWIINEYGVYEKRICPICGGDGVVSKAEQWRELEAVIGDREYDAAQDRKIEEEKDEKTY